MDGMTGRLYSYGRHQALKESATRNNFTSLMWYTERDLECSGIGLRPDEQVTVITKRNAHNEKCEVLMFNGEQTTDPEGLAKLRIMRSGLKGTMIWFGGQKRLMKTYAERGYSTVYWLTLKQLSRFSPPLEVLPGEDGYPFQIEGIPFVFFNADQLVDGPVRIARHLISKGVPFEP